MPWNWTRRMSWLLMRGVIRSLRNDWGGIDDFRHATAIRPEFDDARANLGYADLASGHIADGAMGRV